MKVKMAFINPAAVLLIVGVLIIRINAAVNDPAIESATNSSNHNEDSGHEFSAEIKVAKFDFEYVSGPLTIIVWILIASLAKLGKVLLCKIYNYLSSRVSISNVSLIQNDQIKIAFLIDMLSLF